MDKQSAYKILNLDYTASFVDAKKAYRQLAKKYHPDITESKTGTFDDKQMKEINLAFFYLTPILRAKKTSFEKQASNEKTQKNKTDQTQKRSQAPHQSGQTFVFFSKLFEKIFAGIQSATQSTKKAEGNQTSQSSRQSFPQANNHGNNRAPCEKKSFNHVLRRVHGEEPPQTEKKNKKSLNTRYPQKKSPYQGYQTYMELKKKMVNAKKRRNGNISITKVEKIEPIQPVNSVQRDSN
ncbi:MAG: DnaJ domain-containing protein [Pseudomonadota bacterium]